jgi:N-acetylneuraminic acid mutarotase
MPAPRSGHAVAAVEGKVYVIGGWDGVKHCDDVWQYNPDGDSWRVGTAMPTARSHPAVTTIEGRVYVVGGEGNAGALTVAERYSPAAEDGADAPWSTRAPLPGPAQRPDATAVSGLAMLIGLDKAPGQLSVYNPQTDSWRTSGTPLNDIQELRLVPIGTKLYLIGGRREGQASAGVYEYQVVSTVFLPAVP